MDDGCSGENHPWGRVPCWPRWAVLPGHCQRLAPFPLPYSEPPPPHGPAPASPPGDWTVKSVLRGVAAYGRWEQDHQRQDWTCTCHTVPSQTTTDYLVCLKVISSETQSKKESWIKDPHSVDRNTTPTNNVVARGTAWGRLARASFNDYELKLKKKKPFGTWEYIPLVYTWFPRKNW